MVDKETEMISEDNLIALSLLACIPGFWQKAIIANTAMQEERC